MPSEIILPAGTEFVETANIPELIAEALNPKPANEPRLGRQTESDSAEVKSAAFRRYQVEREHRAMMCCAIADGQLKALSSSSRRRVTVHEPDSGVMVSELAKYVEQFGISVNVTDKTKAAYLQAAYDETGLNGNAINWRYWVHQLPVISAAQAACLMSALEPDLFANLNGRNWQDNPARIDPARNIEKARKTQRLAEAQGKLTASPAEWVGWAQAQSLAVHTGFLLEVEEWLETTSLQGDAAPAAKLEAGADSSPSADDMEEQAPAADDHDEILAALFDPMPVEALAKMFPTDNDATTAQWRKWADKAKANGLIDARENRKFNPYKAGKWFVSKGARGWDTVRLYRTLAKNLPPRSRDDAHLLTGWID